MKLRLTTAVVFSTLLLNARADLIFHDDFSYADGQIITTSTNLWLRHSGSTGDAIVHSGKLEIFTTRFDDINRFMTNVSTGTGPIGPVVYAAFTVNSTNLAGAGVGNYFAHFKDTGTSNFRGRTYGMRGVAPN